MKNKIKQLIDKLNVQATQNVSLEQLLTTVQLLQNEIVGSIKEVQVLGTSGITVMVPNVKPVSIQEVSKVEMQNVAGEKEYFELVMDETEAEDAIEELPGDIPSYEELVRLQQVIKEQEYLLDRLDISETVDKELFAPKIPDMQTESTNVQKEPIIENSDLISDLKGVISDRDRVAYISGLFRGDETMFARSINTINNFNTYQEAEYWIQRELKTKNGWLYYDPLVQQFEQLIKKRFA